MYSTYIDVMEPVSFTAERTINLTCFDCLRVFCDACRYATHSHNVQNIHTNHHHDKLSVAIFPPQTMKIECTWEHIFSEHYVYRNLFMWLYVCTTFTTTTTSPTTTSRLTLLLHICNIPYCLANFMAKEAAFFRLECSVCIVHVAMDKCILLLLGWNIFVVWECLTFMKGIMWIFFLSFFIP